MTRKKKLLIIVAFETLDDRPRYFFPLWSPPAAGMLVAALTSPSVEVEVLHELVREVDLSTDADFVAISFWDLHSPHAFHLARQFRERGKLVVAGGRFPTSNPDDCQPHFDSVVIGDADVIWPSVVEDLLAGTLKPRYIAPPQNTLEGIPPPRYDLAERSFGGLLGGFPFPLTTEASRGCRFSCDFCQLTVDDQYFRKLRIRPIEDVVADVRASKKLPFYARKLASFVDNHLANAMPHAKELLRRLADLPLWGIFAQFTVESLRDTEFVDALDAARCRMAFVGLETLESASLVSIGKTHNKVEEYRELIGRLNEHGIVCFATHLFGMDGDTVEAYRNLPAMLETLGVDVIIPSMIIPIPGTPLYAQQVAEGRIIDTNLAHYDGLHVVFRPATVTPEEMLDGMENLVRRFYAPSAILRRALRYFTRQPWLGLLPWKLFSTIVGFVVFTHLNYLYRRHAKLRVLPLIAEQRAKLSASR